MSAALIVGSAMEAQSAAVVGNKAKQEAALGRMERSWDVLKAAVAGNVTQLEGWNATPAASKTAKANMPTASIAAACHQVERWNATDMENKTAVVRFVTNFASSAGYSGPGMSYPKKASGGFFTTAQPIIIGDGNQTTGEYAISTDPRYRAQNQRLAVQAAADVGVPVGGDTYVTVMLDGEVVDHVVAKRDGRTARSGRVSARLSPAF
jgi:hypothetical protein